MSVGTGTLNSKKETENERETASDDLTPVLIDGIAPDPVSTPQPLPYGRPQSLPNLQALAGHRKNLLSLGGALTGAAILAASVPVNATLALPKHPSICMAKRSFDLVVASLALSVALPLLVLCALAIRIESAGPILFWQQRAGRNGQAFSIAKLRTMSANAESLLSQFLKANPEATKEWKATQKLRNDPRITRVGKLIRKFSLDELPQLWNVLIGEMSLVGPRPIPLYEIPLYGVHFREYCSVRPGLTGLWQVSGRSNTSYTHRIALDCDYVRRWSLTSDLKIIARTLPAVLNAAGAY